VLKVYAALKILCPELNHGFEQVNAGGRVFDAELAHRIDHHIKHLARLIGTF
jgi:hypothetical protein